MLWLVATSVSIYQDLCETVLHKKLHEILLKLFPPFSYFKIKNYRLDYIYSICLTVYNVQHAVNVHILQ